MLKINCVSVRETRNVIYYTGRIYIYIEIYRFTYYCNK